MRVLGISCFYHNAAACVVEDGRIIAAAEEERFSRVKNDARFPRRAIEFCLREANMEKSDIDCVAFYDVPFLTFERILETTLATAPRGLRQYLAAIPEWLTRKLWMRAYLMRELKVKDIRFFPHHISHAASAFFPSPFADAAVIVADGVGEWATLSWGVADGTELTLKEELRFPHSLGLLYSAFTEYLGFTVNSDEYKVMGLAAYGVPRFVEKIERIVRIADNGALHLDMRYFDFVGGSHMTSPAFHNLFGDVPRQPGALIGQREKDIAASIQRVTEECMLRIARMVREKTGKQNLCIAGGVALNCVANGRLLRAKIFDRVWVQPVAGDAGGALGAALAATYESGARRTVGEEYQKGSFLGPQFSPEDIKEFLESNKILYSRHTPERIAELLDSGAIIGHFTGRMEFGPRALGARSILADARQPGMRDRLNAVVKQRESFRPFSPAVLAEHAAKYFEMNEPSSFMSFTFPVRETMCAGIPSAVHADGSARVQTVKEAEPLRQVLDAFYARTGMPLLINTSMNGNGEPIVCTPEEAHNFFLRSKLDALVLGPYLIEAKIMTGGNSSLPLRMQQRIALVLPTSVLETIFTIGSTVASFVGIVLLAVVFYLLLTPLGLMMRLFYDPLERKKVSGSWKDVDPLFGRGRHVA